MHMHTGTLDRENHLVTDEYGSLYRVHLRGGGNAYMAIEEIEQPGGPGYDPWTAETVGMTPCAVATYRGESETVLDIRPAIGHGENHTDGTSFVADDGETYYARPEGWTLPDWIAEVVDDDPEFDWAYIGRYWTQDQAAAAIREFGTAGRVYRDSDGDTYGAVSVA